jgi:triphosphoribosyl-dephospho-CoA synthase
LRRNLTSNDIASAFEQACLAELDALKPGNVHRHAPDSRMSVADFEASARAAAPSMGTSGLTVGRRVRESVRATIAAVGHNTNLGIVLLAAPFAEAALSPGEGDLRDRLGQVLEGLSVADSRDVYFAIREARPGGLGEAERHDVRSEPEVTLLVAMRAAEGRDRIAWNYTNGFSDIFEVGLPALATGRLLSGDAAAATTFLYLTFLSATPDTLIVRKFGSESAAEVQREASALHRQLIEGARHSDLLPHLLAFDASLKGRGFNPGTTADLTVATLFCSSLNELETGGQLGIFEQ